jgi:hypothetical protein
MGYISESRHQSTDVEVISTGSDAYRQSTTFNCARYQSFSGLVALMI